MAALCVAAPNWAEPKCHHVVYSYNGTLLSNKKEPTTDTC